MTKSQLLEVLNYAVDALSGEVDDMDRHGSDADDHEQEYERLTQLLDLSIDVRDKVDQYQTAVLFDDEQ